MIKIAVIGGGRWGKNHIKTLHGLNALGGIIDSHPETLGSHQKTYPNCNTFSKIGDNGALAYPAYVVAIPAQYHFEVAKTLLENGKHVLVEKPITLNSPDATQLIQLAKENNLTLMVGHVLLFHPAFNKMKSLIDAGKIGKIQYMYSNRLNLGTVRTEENSLWNFAPHDISIFEYLTENTPNQVVSRGGAFLQPHLHDTTLTSLHYPNNIVGHIFVSWLHPFKEHRFVVIGSKGMLSYEDTSPKKELLFYEKGIDWVNGEPIKRDGPTEVIPYESSPPLTNELVHFMNCIQKKEDNTKINGEKGLSVLKVLEEADLSLAETFPPRTPSESIKKRDYFVHENSHVAESCTIGEGTKIWQFSNVQENATIGKHSVLGQNVNIGSNVNVGNYVKIQNNVSVYEGVELEDYVFCGPSMVFTNILVPRSKYPQAASKYYQNTLVKEGASLGANATIVCGITIGRFAFIGAGAVVTKDVPDFAVIVGNPGKVVGWMSEGGTKLDFSKD
ncbi:MAG: Gfo/Idh/MocA family oxidoreductase, partial [Candidatus Margulisbacteria bacterium]|nr:Gfo/Idh/MocA family oxidoreductase [Candidatus Margulisiibacteriota bacterium]